eukprot:3705692-Amphidinium_carterae.1
MPQEHPILAAAAAAAAPHARLWTLQRQQSPAAGLQPLPSPGWCHHLFVPPVAKVLQPPGTDGGLGFLNGRKRGPVIWRWSWMLGHPAVSQLLLLPEAIICSIMPKWSVPHLLSVVPQWLVPSLHASLLCQNGLCLSTPLQQCTAKMACALSPLLSIGHQ